MSVTYNRWMW